MMMIMMMIKKVMIESYDDKCHDKTITMMIAIKYKTCIVKLLTRMKSIPN